MSLHSSSRHFEFPNTGQKPTDGIRLIFASVPQEIDPDVNLQKAELN